MTEHERYTYNCHQWAVFALTNRMKIAYQENKGIRLSADDLNLLSRLTCGAFLSESVYKDYDDYIAAAALDAKGEAVFNDTIEDYDTGTDGNPAQYNVQDK